MNSGTREYLYGGPVKSLKFITERGQTYLNSLFKKQRAGNFSTFIVVQYLDAQCSNILARKQLGLVENEQFLSPSDMGFEKAHKLPWSFEIAGDRSCNF